jgi:hypothetical protein
MARGHDCANEAVGQFFWRTRLCLLKGCERPFRPQHPAARYCSEECRRAARRWSAKRARKRYRHSLKGKVARRRQSRAYRQRGAIPQNGSRDPPRQSEGDHYQQNQGILCARAGCYARITIQRRSPCQKYCCFSCRRAMWRVIERERRWRSRVRRRHRNKLTVLRQRWTEE